MPKIIVFGHKHIFSEEGGIEVVVTELYKRLAASNQVTVLDRNDSDKTAYPYNKEEIHVVGIPTPKNRKLNAAVYSFLSTWYCIFHKADVIHIHAEGQCGFLPLLKFFRPHTPVIVTIHGIDWQRSKWGGFAEKYIRFSERMAAKYADQITVLSDHDADYFRQTYGLTNITIIPNGVAAPIFKTEYVRLAGYGLEPGKYILYIGRFAPEKRIDLLVHACQKSRAFSSCKLVLAGPVEDTPNLCKMTMGDGRIVLINNVYGSLKQTLLTWAKLYVLPSDIEGLSMSLLEALSYGDAVLCSDIPQNTSVFKGNEAFLHTFRHGDEDDLARQIDAMCAVDRRVPGDARYAAKFTSGSDEALAQSVVFSERYSWDAAASQYQHLYQEVMHSE